MVLQDDIVCAVVDAYLRTNSPTAVAINLVWSDPVRGALLTIVVSAAGVVCTEVPESCQTMNKYLGSIPNRIHCSGFSCSASTCPQATMNN